MYTSTQFRLVVDGRIEYGVYRAFIAAGQGMTGLEFMYLSEAVSLSDLMIELVLIILMFRSGEKLLRS